MAKVLGKNCDFALGSSATTADPPFNYTDTGMTRIETISNEATLNIETTTVDASVYGTDFPDTEVLTYRWTVDITAYLQTDVAPNTENLFVSALLSLTKRPFILSPNGKPATGEASATQPKYSGRVIIASVSVTPARAGVAQLRCRLTGDGKLDRAVA